jgi:hypothetical protein
MNTVITPAIVAGLLFAGGAAWGPPSHPTARPARPQEAHTCQACHQQIVAGFTHTAHFQTSAEATPSAVKGRFTTGHNVLRTRVRGIYFVMEHRPDGFYETSVDSAKDDRRSARIDMVVGSGRRGQTYLYWSNGQLFEMPVSYLTPAGAWINSPGYDDGQIDWARPIIPRCLECHSTSFTLVNNRGRPQYLPNYELGISCVKCHGDARAHVAYHSAHPKESPGRYIINPARLTRHQQLDNCALCHSGDRKRRGPAFRYRVGEPLADYLLPASGDPVPDVHGNQVGLLERSKCFLATPTMTCATCHDVHQQQRDVAWFAQKCLGCHNTAKHPMRDRIGDRLVADCVDCHMPNRPSNALEFNSRTRRVPMYFRNHDIAIYPAVAESLLSSKGGEPQR